VVSSEPQLDWPAALTRKNNIVDGLVRGVTGLLTSRKVDLVEGWGRLVEGGVEVTGGDGSIRRVDAGKVILATGSRPRGIPGYEIDGTRIVTSDEALDWEAQPGRVAVIGGGVIGCEFASFLADVGTEVHVFEALDQLLPGTDPDAVKALVRAFRRKKISVHTSTMVGPVQIHDGGVVVPFGENSVEVDVVLVAVGRDPVTDNIGLEAVGIATDQGHVPVDPATMQTVKSDVYAVGDIVAGAPQLAHAAFAEAIAAVTHLGSGEVLPVDFNAIPLVTYTHPEVASVGLTEAQAVEQGYEVAVATHAQRGVGRAIIMGETGGLVKVVSQVDGPILGATVVGPAAGEMIHELMYSVAWEALPTEAAAFIHAHPSVSESIGETLLSLAGRSLH
jgi:dihydrolipoamide dehydrogenase